MDCSVIVPCYCSGRWLDELVSRTAGALQSAGLSFEILLINDASPDDTWLAIEKLAAEHAYVRGIDMLFNVGQFRATICGFEHARGEYIVTMDDDLQQAPEDIPRLVSRIRGDHNIDCVIGAYGTKQHGALRNLGSTCMAKLNEMFFDKPRELKTTSFRAMRGHVAHAICAHGTTRPIINSILLRTTNRIVNIEVAHFPRTGGASGYSMRRLVRIMLDNLISSSTLPLKIVSAVGLLSAILSVFLGVFYVLRFVMGGIGVPGFATLVLLTTFFGGTILFSIGILGEYIIRIVHEVGRPPRYIVRGTIDNSEP